VPAPGRLAFVRTGQLLQELGPERVENEAGGLDLLVQLADVPEHFVGLGRDEVELVEELVVGGHSNYIRVGRD